MNGSKYVAIYNQQMSMHCLLEYHMHKEQDKEASHNLTAANNCNNYVKRLKASIAEIPTLPNKSTNPRKHTRSL